ncbi:hypothetical protein QR721_08660 [Aciduricibacillus chroicocephali]|uniref:Uncharacterized protein n=1 Tax=Aciduricibacillus chroicocephali TaxID=3054939 RepID=A0ABY9KSE8_9BACI|nr:hypothetical protein QR721_08660 [Bacillaceae bacterium 44XB]
MIMILFFSLIGALFYKLFLTSPPVEKKAVIKKEKVVAKKKAADMHV